MDEKKIRPLALDRKEEIKSTFKEICEISPLWRELVCKRWESKWEIWLDIIIINGEYPNFFNIDKISFNMIFLV